MQAKKIEQPPDPNLALEQEAAKRVMITNLQNQAELDTASLMARFGTRLALSGTGISPATPAATGRGGGIA